MSQFYNNSRKYSGSSRNGPLIIHAPRARKSNNNGDPWNLLQNGIKAIHNKQEFSFRFEELYRSAYQMYLNREGLAAYKGMQRLVQDYLENKVDSVLEPNISLGVSLVANDGSASVNFSDYLPFLNALNSLWKDHLLSIRLIRDIMMYIDENFVTGDMPHLVELGMWLFVDHVINSRRLPVKQIVINGCLAIVNADRSGECVPKSTLSAAAHMLCELYYREPIPPELFKDKCSSDFVETSSRTCYAKLVEPFFLAQSSLFFSEWRQRALQQSDLSAYLTNLQVLYDSERQLCRECLLESQFLPLEKLILEKCLVQDFKLLIDVSTLADLMASASKMMALKTLYTFLIKANNEECSKAFDACLEPCWTRLQGPPEPEDLEKTARACSWIERILALKAHADELVDNAFSKSPHIEKLFNQSYFAIVNGLESASEFLAIYVDQKLRKYGRVASEQDLMGDLSKAIMLFKFIAQKDVFETHYRLLLMKRLLILDKRTDEDFEVYFLGKLKQECGQQFTFKMEKMLQDNRLSAEFSEKFAGTLKEPLQLCGVPVNSFFVSVLNSCTWPTVADQNFMLSLKDSVFPKFLASFLEYFESFYGSSYTGRKLQWTFALGTAELKVNFDSGSCVLLLNTPMFLILVCSKFEESAKVSYKDIKTALEPVIGETLVKRALTSLTHGKHKILLRETRLKSNSKTYLTDFDSDFFSLNLSFKPPSYKVKVPMVRGSNAKGQRAETPPLKNEVQVMKQILESRKYIIDATIVRIMKSRRSLQHSSLMALVIEQLISRFQPTPSLIKERIEDLISREYLERSAEDRTIYIYQA